MIVSRVRLFLMKSMMLGKIALMIPIAVSCSGWGERDDVRDRQCAHARQQGARREVGDGRHRTLPRTHSIPKPYERGRFLNDDSI